MFAVFEAQENSIKTLVNLRTIWWAAQREIHLQLRQRTTRISRLIDYQADGDGASVVSGCISDSSSCEVFNLLAACVAHSECFDSVAYTRTYASYSYQFHLNLMQHKPLQWTSKVCARALLIASVSPLPLSRLLWSAHSVWPAMITMRLVVAVAPFCSQCESVLLKVLLAKVPAYTHTITLWDWECSLRICKTQWSSLKRIASGKLQLFILQIYLKLNTCSRSGSCRRRGTAAALLTNIL